MKSYRASLTVCLLLALPVTGWAEKVEMEENTVCDPTYINADIGQAMPQFKGVSPEVVPVKL